LLQISQDGAFNFLAAACYNASGRMIIRKLAVSNFSAHRVRAALTCAAIALSVSLVVCVTSGYSSLEASANRFLGRFMGTADAMITRQGDPHAGIPETLVEQLRLDPDVKKVTGRLELESGLVDAKGQPIMGRPAQVIGIRRPGDDRIENLSIRAGQWFDASDGDVAVIDQVAAEKLSVNIGDSFTLPGPSEQLKLTVVGIVQKPQILASNIQSLYLPIQTLQKFAMPDQPPQVNRVMIDLQSNANIDEFVARWNPKLALVDPSLKIRLARDNRKELDRNLQGVHILSYLGSAVSMLAAMFIIFSALSMGVAERSRTLAMLRAIGAFRGQIGRLVVLEGVVLAIIGGVAGVPLGWFWTLLAGNEVPQNLQRRRCAQPRRGAAGHWGFDADGAVRQPVAGVVGRARAATGSDDRRRHAPLQPPSFFGGVGRSASHLRRSIHYVWSVAETV
jgi:putative ABC transport system permease protein